MSKRKGMGSKSALSDLKAALNKRQEESNQLLKQTDGQTWVKRAVLEKQRVEAFMEEREQKAQQDEADFQQRLNTIDQALAKKEKQLVTAEEVSLLLTEGIDEANDDAEPPLSTFEVFERLRDIAEPVTLFGETDMQRYKRMKKAEKEQVEGKKDPNAIVQAIADVPDVVAPQQEDDGDVTGDEGAAAKVQKTEEPDNASDNDVDLDDTDWRLANAARDSDTDTDDDDEDAGPKPNQRAGQASDTDTDDDDEEAAAAAEGQKKKKKKKKDKKDKKNKEDLDLFTMPEDEYAEQCDTIKEWLTKVMKAWENDLASKPEAEKKRGQVKVEIAQHRQSRRDCKPLKKRLRFYSLDRLLCPKLYDIVALANNGEYRAAGERYLDLSIGKAAWPVGLGNAGGMLIEDGPGFMKTAIKEDDIAKVLRDETVRKYVQSMKRLITIQQRYWPPTEPSKGTL